MLTRYAYNDLGTGDFGWLKARYHFSFSGYRNPERRGFGKLLVINDDIVAPANGFNPHPHENMEIITYIREGAITHKDNVGNEGITKAGDVQVMSAGTGIFHSEYNLESVPTKLYQIWIRPEKTGVKPRWETKDFPGTLVQSGGLPLLVSGQPEHEGQGALYIHQDAAIYAGRLAAGANLMQSIKHQAYILVSKGNVVINDVTLSQGDGAELTGEKELRIVAESEAEILIIDVPE